MFILLMRLIDFSPLRPALAQGLGWTSAHGWTPFDPIPIFLLHGWQITNRWNRAQTLKDLRKPCFADYVCGASASNTPNDERVSCISSRFPRIALLDSDDCSLE